MRNAAAPAATAGKNPMISVTVWCCTAVRFCKARSPQCDGCCLKDICKTGKKSLTGNGLHAVEISFFENGFL